jgi:hypothetical protein
VAVIAGYVSTVDEWCLFIAQWQRLLDHYKIPYIHMRELEHFRGPYEGWNAEKREALLKKVRQIIWKRTKSGFASAVRQKDFLSVLPEPMRAFIGGPYGWCAQTLLDLVNHWKETQKIHSPISWVFEKGQKKHEARQVHNMFFELEKDPSLGMAGTTWTFADWDLFPLQSADVLAYEVYRQAVHQYGGAKLIEKPAEFHRREGRSLVRRDVDFPNLEIWTSKSLALWLEGIPAHMRNPVKK